MMNRVHFLWLIFLLWGRCSAECELHNVIELVDNGAGENAYKSNTSVLRFFNAALQQKSAVIVVSGVIVHMWLHYADFFERELLSQQDALFKKDNFDIAQELNARATYLRALGQTFPGAASSAFLDQKIFAMSAHQRNALALAENNDSIKVKALDAYRCYKRLGYVKDWRIFHDQPADVFLWVPRDVVIENIKQSFNIDGKHEVVGGADQLYAAVRGWNNLADRIKDCLPRSIKHSFDHHTLVKFAALCGLGGAAAVGLGIGVVPAAVTAGVAFAALALVQQCADFVMQKKRIFFPVERPVQVQNLYNFNSPATWVFFRIGHGAYTPGNKRNGKPSTDILNNISFERIAGIPVPDALDRLRRFGQSGKTLAAIDITCNGGGYHAQQISQALATLSPAQQYLYCMVSLTDAGPSSPYSPSVINLGELFDDVRMLERKEYNVPAPLVFNVALSSLRRFAQKNEPGEKNVKIPNNPLVFAPGAKRLLALDMQQHVLIVAADQLQSCLVPDACEAVFLYSSQVKTPLFIRRAQQASSPVFVSMLPGDVVHHMASIDINASLDNVIKESFFNFSEWCQKDFLIEHVRCLQYKDSGLDAGEHLDLEHVSIHKEPANTLLGYFVRGQARVNGHVYCKLAAKDRYYKAAIEDVNASKRTVTIDPFLTVSKQEFETAWNKAHHELAHQDSWPYEPIEPLLDQWFARQPANSFFPDPVIKKYVLDNGLTVLLWQHAAAPKVFMQLTYGVGSAAEDAHERGIAHVVEHMMFNGTDKFSEQDISAIARKFGAYMNAETSWDFTWYYFDVIKNNWQPFIEILADCMQHARFDEQHLASEIKTVMQEIRSVKDMSSRVMYERMFELSFPPNHPYHFCIAGYAEELSRLKRSDLKGFCQKYYRPDNAVLFMVGDFDVAQAECEIQKHFGSIKRASLVLKRRDAPTPLPQALAQRTQYFDEIKKPLLGCFWLIPGLKDKHEAVASVVEFLLGNSIGGRLVQRLVNQARVAHRVQVQATKHMDGGLFMIKVCPAVADYTICYKLIEQELKNIVAHGFMQQELQAMLKNKERIFFERMNRLEDFVRNWSKSYFSTGDEKAIFHRPRTYAHVTSSDVQQFVKTYLDPFLMQRIEVLPLPRHKRHLSARVKRSRTVVEKALFKNHTRQAPLEKPVYAQKLKNPDVPLVHVPQPECIMTLPNGLKVVMLTRNAEPLVHVVCGLMNEDYVSLALDGIAVKLLLSALFDHPCMKKVFYDHGVDYHVTATGIAFSMLSRDCERVLSEIAKRFGAPQFMKESFERTKARLANSYEQWGRNPHALVHRTICEMMYSCSPYNWSFDDAVAYIKRMSGDEIKSLYQKYFGAHNMILVLVGHFEVTRVQRIIEKEFSGIAAGKEFVIPADFSQNPRMSNKNIDLANNLVLLALAEPSAVTMQSADFNALKLLDMVNFHGRGSRLFALREEYGLFYTGFGGFAVEAARLPGFNYLGASLAHDMVEQGEALLRTKMRELKTGGITHDELMAAKQMLTKKLVDKVSTGASIAPAFAHLASLNLGFDYYDKQLKQVREITLEEVNKVAAKYFNPDNMSCIRIGRL